MNKQRREQLQKVIDQLSEIRDEVDTLAGEEQYYFDNMPEGLQSSDKGQMAEEAAQKLGDAKDQIEDLLSLIEEAMQ